MPSELVESFDRMGATFNIGIEAIQMLDRLTQIIINEFSYDGQDPKGVKAYQGEVDKARDILDRFIQSTK